MREIKKLKEMQAFSLKAKQRGKTICLVPTMGYLHEGHLSLVEAAKKKGDITVVSIFVNPLQFGPSEDLARYPRDLARDKKLLKNFEVDVLFLPAASQLYPDDFKSFVEVEGLSKKLCGRTRPTHFRGVTTIVAKLFNLVMPDFTFFGEKDYQQQIIIKKMVRNLNFPVQIISLPTIREFDGLAMSSRNQSLAPKERASATVLYRALLLAKQEIEKGEKDPHRLLLRMRSLIGTEPTVRLDYIAIVDPHSLEDKKRLDGQSLIALAAYLGKARLIDNIAVTA